MIILLLLFHIWSKCRYIHIIETKRCNVLPLPYNLKVASRCEMVHGMIHDRSNDNAKRDVIYYQLSRRSHVVRHFDNYRCDAPFLHSDIANMAHLKVTLKMVGSNLCICYDLSTRGMGTKFGQLTAQKFLPFILRVQTQHFVSIFMNYYHQTVWVLQYVGYFTITK